MVSYIQTTNRNSFTLRYKKYKRLRNDVWGRLALRNKKNNVTALIRLYAQRELNKRIRHLIKSKKRRIRKKLKIRYKMTQFQYSIQEKPKVRPGRPYGYRVTFKFLLKTLRFFYNLNKTRSSLRKLFSPIHRSVSKRYNKMSLERRADVLFYRANFVDTVRQARLFIKKKQLFYLIPNHKKKNAFVTQKIIAKPYTQIPLFAFFKPSPLLAYKRKQTLHHALKSRNKFFAIAPKWILFDYKLMLALLIKNPINVKYHFPYSKTVTSFVGAARYF
jgi:ribosomal protein S4